uniref:non-specific serine/threonine protein kinase n=1 Tax=Leersia perrieri TaxID=77586 RepID=A0A0D9UW22_9ORYZ
MSKAIATALLFLINHGVSMAMASAWEDEDFTKNCPLSQCSDGGPEIRFPHRLESSSSSSACGTSCGSLACSGKDTILHHPFLGPCKVAAIDYKKAVFQIIPLVESLSPCPLQKIIIEDLPEPDYRYSRCSLYDAQPGKIVRCSKVLTPSTSWTGVYDGNIADRAVVGPISCLGDPSHFSYLVDAQEDIYSLPLDCKAISKGIVPISGTANADSPTFKERAERIINFAEMTVSWFGGEIPYNCMQCEQQGRRCAFSSQMNQTFCMRDKTQGSRVKVIAATTSAGALIVVSLVLAIALYLFLKSRYSEEVHLKVEMFLRTYGTSKPTRYTFSEVKKIARHFKEKVGQGGFGTVYKGMLPNGVPVAVKMLENPTGDGGEFINEVATIGKIHHANIIRLLGFCSEGTRRALIYEFMPNESLEKYIFLHNPNTQAPLSPNKMLDIALGIARGMEYLHQGCNQRILHFDIKPRNILLDYNFNPKISDFGLAKLCARDQSIFNLTKARGTMGYIAPELYSRNFGDISYKSDVYSFGMLVLEMVSGRRIWDPSTENQNEVYFPEWIYEKVIGEQDFVLSREMTEEEKLTVRQLALVALWCIQWNPRNRPSMTKVVNMITGKLENMQVPPKLFVSNSPDFFDISIINGFNLPMAFLPDNKGSSGCSKGPQCAANITSKCPTELKTAGGCKSQCSIATGRGDCQRTNTSELFEKMCPDVFVNTNGILKTYSCPSGTNYEVVFCPPVNLTPVPAASPQPAAASPSPHSPPEVFGHTSMKSSRAQKHWVMEEDQEEEFGELQGTPIRFTFQQLNVATEQFRDKLGEGGFGSVFQGKFGEERIAVKRLDRTGQGKREFSAEVQTIGSIHHIHLVRLIGFCAEKSHRLLVYEYMPKGSLEKWIYHQQGNNTPLDWPTRRKIIIHVAKGLAYLHEECMKKIAHLDVKPQNILLDDNFNAKLSDFGLCKLIDRDKSHVITRMRGTPGYLAPEWLTSQITEKADIYSFGVVVMEISSGRKNLDTARSEESIHLITLLEEKVKNNQLVDLIDKHNNDMQVHKQEVVQMMKLAMWCLQVDGRRRPQMSEVVKVLEGNMDAETNIDHFFVATNPANFGVGENEGASEPYLASDNPRSPRTEMAEGRSTTARCTHHLLLLVPLLLVAANTNHAATLNITNRCSFTVWPAAMPVGGGTRLDPGKSWTLDVPTGTALGRVWARTGCSFKSNGTGSCQTGDCGGVLSCKSSGNPPYTLAEFSINQINRQDFFDISLTDGFNVPMDFVPVPESPCRKGPRCRANITSQCPRELEAPGGCNTSVIGSISALTIFITCITIKRRKRRYQEMQDEEQEFEDLALQGMPRRFTFQQLQEATHQFRDKLGEGGFGSVFMGQIADERLAIKRLDRSGQGMREFLAEVQTIGSIHHINLVRLIGFCVEKSQRLLVYEYMPKGSLDRWIYHQQGSHAPALDWRTRYKIITEVAKGLSYLHEECTKRIAHLDVKPQNILLDDNFNAKLSDFGLCKLIDRDTSQVITRMRGTPGYLAPEWLTSQITEKADVYSFGIVVMEIISGRKNLDSSRSEQSIHLITLLQEKVKSDQLVDLIDKHSNDMQVHKQEVLEMMQLAMWCLQIDCKRRPQMSDVVKVLEGAISIDTEIDHDFVTTNPISFDVAGISQRQSNHNTNMAARGTMTPCTHHLLFLLLLIAANTNHAATLNITNLCSFTVWPAAVPVGGGMRLDAGMSWALDVPAGTASGIVWARTGCSFNANGNGSCQTGDCGGVLSCMNKGNPPMTLAEFSFNQSNRQDFFDISLLQGFNVPMDFLPVPEQIQGAAACSKGAHCSENVTSQCPRELKVPGGCNSACNVFKQDKYCCTGNGTNACEPTTYSLSLVRMCPDAYSYSRDDSSSTQFTCPSGTNYQIIFCPPDLTSPSPILPPVGRSGMESSSKRGGRFVAAITASVIGSTLVLTIVIAYIIIKRRIQRHREMQEEEQEFDAIPLQGMPRRFTFQQLQEATAQFRDKLGEGGFGSVFIGQIGGERVAVKRLDQSGQGMREFLAEVQTIGSIHHINLVRLIGFCAEKSRRLLVYEHMPKGSLDRWVYHQQGNHGSPLHWPTRYKIITQVAKGLSYLHEECTKKIAHLDVKPQNILLDDNFNAKLSDFGLCKLIDRDKSQVITRMRGTPGYLAPEWLTSHITEKADVYSFGIVVMEIISGRKNLDTSRSEQSIHLITLLQEKAKSDQLADMIDKHSNDMPVYEQEVIEMMKLAMWCLQIDCKRRPQMSEVVKVLEGTTSIDTDIDHEFVTTNPHHPV